MINHSSYIKFIDEALGIAKSIPKYFSKYSNKIYCNHQKLVIVVLMQKLKMTSRSIVEFFKSNEELRMYIGLHRIPVHTTIIRFLHKIRNLIGKILGIKQACKVAVDSTGFELESRSYYFRKIDKNLLSNFSRKTKRFMKLSIAIDTDTQLILSHKIRRGPRNDNIDFKILLKGIDVDYVMADKGYSSKANRNFVINKLGAIPIIPRKKNEGIYRYSNDARLRFDDKIYHQRSKVETVFSVIKRKYGSFLRCRKFATQKVELICKLIAYNIDRKINYLCTSIGLHQSRFCGSGATFK